MYCKITTIANKAYKQSKMLLLEGKYICVYACDNKSNVRNVFTFIFNNFFYFVTVHSCWCAKTDI